MTPTGSMTSFLKWNDICCLLFVVCWVTQSGHAQASYLSDNQRGLSMQTPARQTELDHLSRRDKLQLTKLLQRIKQLPLDSIVDPEEDALEVSPAVALEMPQFLDVDILSNGMLEDGQNSPSQRRGEDGTGSLYALRQKLRNSLRAVPVSDPYTVDASDFLSLPEPDIDVTRPVDPSSERRAIGLLAQLFRRTRPERGMNHEMVKKGQPCFYNIITCY